MDKEFMLVATKMNEIEVTGAASDPVGDKLELLQAQISSMESKLQIFIQSEVSLILEALAKQKEDQNTEN